MDCVCSCCCWLLFCAIAAGKFGFWRFDKRTYAKPPPRRLGDPPEKMQNDMVRALISHINEATGELREPSSSWFRQQYHATTHATCVCAVY